MIRAMEKRIAVKSDWETNDMPVRNAQFKLETHLTAGMA